jgi:putative ABC transport system substrate-binding protein
VDEGVDLIISTSTPASQAAFSAVQDLEAPIVIYNVVTDPFAAGLATAPDDHPGWIVGTQALPPVATAMETMMEIVPDAEVVGIIWNPAEKNSEVATGIAREVAGDLGIELLEANISDSSEIQTAAESLVAQDIDAFFISTDSTVVAGFEALVKVANENQIPLFANDPASAGRGAVAAVGVDYFQDGVDSGTIAAAILAGDATPSDFTVERQSASILAIKRPRHRGLLSPRPLWNGRSRLSAAAKVNSIEGHNTLCPSMTPIQHLHREPECYQPRLLWFIASFLSEADLFRSVALDRGRASTRNKARSACNLSPRG